MGTSSSVPFLNAEHERKPVEPLYHTIEEIDCAVRRLPCVPTDNREALVALGFERMYPRCVSGYESHLWVRSVDAESLYGSSRRHKRLVMQRAYLHRPHGTRHV
jgi:hypothetical protein